MVINIFAPRRRRTTKLLVCRRRSGQLRVLRRLSFVYNHHRRLHALYLTFVIFLLAAVQQADLRILRPQPPMQLAGKSLIAKTSR